MRFASAQILAYVEDDLWLRLARQANAAATGIAQRLALMADVRLVAPVQANELFVELPSAQALEGLQDAGFLFQRRGPRLARFVCRWDSDEAECAALVAAIGRQLAAETTHGGGNRR